jgi:hypothetical protein
LLLSNSGPLGSPLCSSYPRCTVWDTAGKSPVLERLDKNLKKWDFKSNPYDWSVANKMIDGKQCTVLWHVDDIKVSHEDPKVVTPVLKLFEERYGKEAPLTITRGKKHDYLGMILDYSKDGKVKYS